MSAREVVVEFIGKDRGLNSAIGSAEAKSGKLGSTLAKVGKVAALGLAAGVAIAGKALYEATQAAMEDQAAQEKLATTLRNTTGARQEDIDGVEEWITAQGKALGVTDDDLRPALSRLVTATHDVAEAQKLASLAMDVSAGTGKSLESVSTALMKAQNGQVSSLARLGIETTDAEGKTLSFKDATQKMADTFGGQAAKQADTLAGKTQRLKVMFDETKEAIGARLIPVVSKMADWFIETGMPALQDFGDTIREHVGPVVEKLVGWFRDDLMPALKKAGEEIMPVLKDTFEDMAKSFKDGQPTFKKLGDFITDALIPALTWLIKKTLPALGFAFKWMVKQVEQVGNIVTWLWNNAFQPSFKFILDAVARTMKMWAAMLDALSHVPGFGWAADAADKMNNAADEAHRISENLKKIPSRKDVAVNVNVDYNYTGLRDPERGHGGVPGFAKGTASAPGGLAIVGEQGPELVRLPRGSAVHTASQTRAMLAGDGGGDTHITIELDGRAIWQGLLRQRRLIGKGLGLG